jgi:hypothetical protein
MLSVAAVNPPSILQLPRIPNLYDLLHKIIYKIKFNEKYLLKHTNIMYMYSKIERSRNPDLDQVS